MNLLDKVAGMCILLIDDDGMLRDSMRIFFDGQRVDFKAVASAEEGLKDLALRTPEIILVDYKLPGVDGLEFLRIAQGSHPDAIKILITAHGSRAVCSEAVRCGASGYVEKPLSIEKLQDCLIQILEEG